MIGRLFNVSKATVRWNYKKYLQQGMKHQLNGRPSILSVSELEDLINKIINSYTINLPWTMHDIVHHITEQYGKTLEVNTIRHVLNRDSQIKTCRGIPMEEKRLQVSQQDIETYFTCLDEIIEGVPAHFIYNMDEMGHQEWADRQEKVCYVPKSHPHEHVYFPVSRTGKRITIVGCIAADGSFCKPLVVIPRKTYDRDLALTGITEEKVQIYYQIKGYMDKAIFLSWLSDVFLPEVARRREALDYEGHAVLIMDNCSAHTGLDVEEVCEAHGVIICPLPPHSSNQIQPLDLSTFGITKRLIARINRMETVNIQSSHIGQVVSAFMSASSPSNVVGTFRSAGIVLFLGLDLKLYCHVSPEQARCLIMRFIPSEETAPTEDEVEEAEENLYLEHCAETKAEEIQSEEE
jgi:hypothetical protein